MTSRCFVLAGVIAGLSLMTGCSFQTSAYIHIGTPTTPEPADDCACDVEDAPVLTTVLLETGQARLATASSISLERFMQDLNRRKDHAIACTQGAPSPDSEYLWSWLQQVCAELQRRGYHFDSDGNLYHGTQAIPLR